MRFALVATYLCALIIGVLSHAPVLPQPTISFVACNARVCLLHSVSFEDADGCNEYAENLKEANRIITPLSSCTLTLQDVCCLQQENMYVAQETYTVRNDTAAFLVPAGQWINLAKIQSQQLFPEAAILKVLGSITQAIFYTLVELQGSELSETGQIGFSTSFSIYKHVFVDGRNGNAHVLLTPFSEYNACTKHVVSDIDMMYDQLPGTFYQAYIMEELVAKYLTNALSSDLFLNSVQQKFLSLSNEPIDDEIFTNNLATMADYSAFLRPVATLLYGEAYDASYVVPMNVTASELGAFMPSDATQSQYILVSLVNPIGVDDIDSLQDTIDKIASQQLHSKFMYPATTFVKIISELEVQIHVLLSLKPSYNVFTLQTLSSLHIYNNSNSKKVVINTKISTKAEFHTHVNELTTGCADGKNILNQPDVLDSENSITLKRTVDIRINDSTQEPNKQSKTDANVVNAARQVLKLLIEARELSMLDHGCLTPGAVLLGKTSGNAQAVAHMAPYLMLSRPVPTGAFGMLHGHHAPETAALDSGSHKAYTSEATTAWGFGMWLLRLFDGTIEQVESCDTTSVHGELCVPIGNEYVRLSWKIVPEQVAHVLTRLLVVNPTERATLRQVAEMELFAYVDSASPSVTIANPFSISWFYYQQFLQQHKTPIANQFSHLESMLSGVPVSRLYTIRNEIGKGSNATVYIARHNQTGQRFALKRFKELVSYDKEAIFLNEPMIHARLSDSKYALRQHAIHGKVKDGGIQIYLVLELASMSLYNYLALKKVSAQNSLAHHAIVFITRQIFEGLAELHDRRVIHGDLTAKNLLVNCDPDGKIKSVRIADFGNSLLLDSATDMSNQSLSAIGLGTVTIEAPECLRGQPYGSSKDIWSAGIVLRQIFEGVTLGGSSLVSAMTAGEMLVALSTNGILPQTVMLTDIWVNFLISVLDEDKNRRITAKQALEMPALWHPGSETLSCAYPAFVFNAWYSNASDTRTNTPISIDDLSDANSGQLTDLCHAIIGTSHLAYGLQQVRLHSTDAGYRLVRLQPVAAAAPLIMNPRLFHYALKAVRTLHALGFSCGDVKESMFQWTGSIFQLLFPAGLTRLESATQTDKELLAVKLLVIRMTESEVKQ